MEFQLIVQRNKRKSIFLFFEMNDKEAEIQKPTMFCRLLFLRDVKN